MNENGRTVSFEPIEGDADHLKMTEVFDLSHPKCAMTVFDQSVWPWKKREDAVSVTRVVTVPKWIAP